MWIISPGLLVFMSNTIISTGWQEKSIDLFHRLQSISPILGSPYIASLYSLKISSSLIFRGLNRQQISLMALFASIGISASLTPMAERPAGIPTEAERFLMASTPFSAAI